VLRRRLAIFLILIVGLQSSTIGYAASIGPHDGFAATSSLPCPGHAGTPRSGRDNCCSPHAMPASCLAHCLSVVALPSPPLVIASGAARIALDRPGIVSFPSEHPLPALRPPIL
jgi:hypothetical protein